MSFTSSSHRARHHRMALWLAIIGALGFMTLAGLRQRAHRMATR